MRRNLVIIVIVIFILILLCATIFSIAKFNVWNPVSSCCGMLEILFTDKEYTIVQNIPNRVIFSKSSKQYLDDYMANRGFQFVPEKQMGGMLVYSNGREEEHIILSINKYYSIFNFLFF